MWRARKQQQPKAEEGELWVEPFSAPDANSGTGIHLLIPQTLFFEIDEAIDSESCSNGVTACTVPDVSSWTRFSAHVTLFAVVASRCTSSPKENSER
jgi:hypothetical protein